jgi:crotonobetainyl-CoA:carnitine CoA-transferase CaiB-like acyl-CoA transferase
MSSTTQKALEGIKILELGQLVAAPFAASMLGYFGAEVIKVEPLGGDPLRTWRGLDKDGVSPWWRSISRNKKSISLDLKNPSAQNIVKRLGAESDVLIENFKPKTLEKWGLGPDAFPPSLIYTRVSGYGQTGPLAQKPGFASVCEAFGGYRFVNGYPGQAPVRQNVSMGDTVAGLHAIIGILLSLVARNKLGKGQVVDVAIYESVFNLMEGVLPEYDRLGTIREPSGTTVTGIVPTNCYPTSDGKFVIIGGNNDSLFVRLMNAIGRKDLAQDERLAKNPGRVKHEKMIDDAISEWTRKHTEDKIVNLLDAASVPAGPIYSIADVVENEHFKARDMFEKVEVGGGPLLIPAYSPKLVDTPGSTTSAGPELGAHTREVLRGLGMMDHDIDDLEARGVIKCHRS